MSIDDAPVIDLDGEQIVDFVSTPMFNSTVTEVESVKIIDIKLAGRPHSIAEILLGSQNYMDILFSYNGYSNPLTVKGGDVLMIPPIEALKKAAKIKSDVNQTINELNKRLSEVDQNRIKFLSGSTTVKSPNMNESGVQYVKVGRAVLLGKTSNTVADASTESSQALINILK